MAPICGEAIPVPIRFSRRQVGLFRTERAELTNSGDVTLCRIARSFRRRTADCINENRVQAERLNPVVFRPEEKNFLRSVTIDRN